MRFRTGALIGRGGAGDVYKAFDPDLGRTVALKMLRRDDPASAQRFLREARSQAALDHPNVCEVYATGEIDGQLYIAMRWVEGTRIDEHCRGRPLEEKIRLVADVAGALQAAHTAGLVHRDLKPSNLLVEETPEGPHAYVLDFGIARHLETGGPTETGEVLGTAGYMSPEQARGEIASLDRRADVFSLGCVLFELLAGRRAFERSNPMETLLATLNDEPERLRRLAPAVPRDLEVIVHRALEKDRERRYPSARSLQEDLERWLRGEPIEARSLGVVERFFRWARRRRALAVGLAVALVALLAGGVLARRERSLAAERAELARRYGREAEALEATLRVAHLAPLHDTAPLRRRIAGRLDEIEDDVPGLGRTAAGPALFALAAGRLALEEHLAALDAAEAAVAIGLETPAVDLLRARALAGLYREGLGEVRRIEAEAVREARVLDLERNLRDPALELVAAAGELGESVASLVEAEVALLEGDLERALELATRTVEAEPWRYEAEILAGETELARADRARSDGDLEALFAALDDAETAVRRAVAVGRSAPGAHGALCDVLSTRVDLRFFASGELRPADVEAVDGACTAAVAADSTSTAPHEKWSYTHVVRARWLNEFATADPFPAIGRAEQIARAALEIDERSPIAHRRLGDALLFRAEFERERGLEAARETILEAKDRLERAREIDPTDPVTWNALGLAFWEIVVQRGERGEDELDALEGAVRAFEGAVERVPEDSKARTNLATLIKMRGRYESQHGRDPSLELERAISELESVIATDPTYSIAYNNLGDAHAELAGVLRERGEDPSTQLESALRRLAEASDRNPEWAFPWYNRAGTLEEHAEWVAENGGDPEPLLREALACWLEGLERRDNLPEVWSRLAEVRLRLAARLEETGRGAEGRGQRAAAAAAARRALELDPDHATAAETLSRLEASETHGAREAEEGG